MSRIIRRSLVFGVITLFVAISLVPAAHAQRRSGGGNYGSNNQQGGNQQGTRNNSNNQNNSQNNNQNNNQGFNQNQNNDNKSDQDDDDNNDKDKKNKNRNSNNNNKNSNNQNNKNDNQPNDDQQNAQQMLKGQTGKQGNNFNPQGQGNNPQMQFKSNKSNQQFQNFQQGDWQKKKWNGPNDVNVWNKQYNNGPKPFSKQWYNDHPKAWYNDHNHWDDNVWVVATVPGVGTWLGWDNYPRNNNVVYGYSYPGGNQQQIVDPAVFGEWFPLGVYSLMTGPNDQGTRMLQLAVDRDGNLSGTYYDIVSDTSHRVSGRIRQSSQRASWSIDTNDQLTFYAPLDQLTQQQGIVTVQMPGGEQQWQIIRLQNPGN